MKLVYNGHKCKLLVHNVARIRSGRVPLLKSYFGTKKEFDCRYKSLQGILTELSCGDFRRCASLVLVLFLPDNRFLKKMEELFNECDHLKYLTKLVFLGYEDRLRIELLERIEAIKQKGRQSNTQTIVRHMGRQFVKISHTNLISIIQERLNVYDTIYDFVPLLHHITHSYCKGSESSLQRFLLDQDEEWRDRMFRSRASGFQRSLSSKQVSFDWTTNEPLYLFNINPALGVIINHNTFLTARTRCGSERDVQSLIEAFERKRMPYIVISDGSAEDVHRCMALLKDSIMGAFEAIYVFVMSHGTYGDIINTKTLQYQIDEHIATPLTSNPSLGNVKMCIFVNACRGKYDPRFATFKDKDNVTATDTRQQPPNLVKLYGTKPNRVSLRNRITGSIFVQQVCEEFNQISHERNLQEMVNAVEAKIALKSVFKNGTTEYCVHPGTQHTLKVTFRNFTALQKVLMYLEAAVNGKCEHDN